MEKEIWKNVVGYENLYLVSSFGRVLSLFKNKNKILKQISHPLGYMKVNLYKDKKMKTFFVHRLVAVSFLNNEKNKNEINHLDGNKKNNNLNNLEWCFGFENIRHAHDSGLCEEQRKKTSIRLKNNKIKAKEVLDLQTGIFYPSLKKACNAVNLNPDIESYRIKQNKKNRFTYINN
jgi:hypothetical protein